MKRPFKIIIWLLVVVVVMLIGLAILLPIIIDPNDYKQEIAGLVKKQTGRDVEIIGDMKLSVFPWLGMETGELTVSNPPAFGEQPMLKVKRADIKAKLVPLLRRELEVDTVTLEEPTVHLIIDRQGKTNWDDLAGGPAEKSEPGIALAALAVQGVQIKNGRIMWEDRQAKAEYAVSRLDLTTGRILEGKPVELSASFDVKDASLPQAAAFKFDGMAALDIDTGNASLRDVSMNTVYGDVKADLRTPSVSFDQKTAMLAMDGSALDATMGEDKMTLKWSALTFNLEKQMLSMSNTEVTGSMQNRAVNVSLPKLMLNVASQELDIPQLGGDIDGIQVSSSLKGVKIIDKPVFSGHLKTEPFDLRPVLKSLELSVPTQDPNALSQLVAEGDFNATLESVEVKKLSLKVDDTSVTGSVGIAGFAKPKYEFDLSVDRLHVDRYLPPVGQPPAGGKAAAEPVPTAGVLVLPLGLFRDLQANGRLRMGEMKLSGLAVRDIQVAVRSTPGNVTVEPLSASLYGGTLQGAMQFVESQGAARLETRQTVTAVELGELLSTLEITNDIVGKGDLTMAVKAEERGDAQTVDGTAGFHIRDGAIKGVNLRKIVLQAKQVYSQLKGRQAEVEMEDKDEFQFTEMTGTIKFNEKLATNDDLAIKSPLLRVSGAGQADLVAGTLDYLIKVNVVETTKGQGGQELQELKGITIPVRVKGKLDDPKYRLDAEALVKDAAKRKVEKKVDEKKEQLEKKLEDKLQKGLQKLFK